MNQPDAWLPSNASKNEEMRLLCFPHAGGGTAMFHRWNRRLEGVAHVVPIKLPGREDRAREPAIDNLSVLVDQLTGNLASFLHRGPVALFGHSMGGLICYEWAQRLRADGIDVKHVFVSSCRPPHRFRMPNEPLHLQPDRAMIERLNGKYGTGAAISKSELELMMFMAPTIRADLKLLESYVQPDHKPLTCPLSILGGAEDGQITRTILQEWETHSTGDFKLRIFPGHHFYIRSQDEAVTKFIRSRL